MFRAMQSPLPLTDRDALARNRARADRAALFLHDEVMAEVQERLAEVNRTFTHIAVVTPFPDIWDIPGATVGGLPVGLSIVGARGSDAALVAVAQALE